MVDLHEKCSPIVNDMTFPFTRPVSLSLQLYICTFIERKTMQMYKPITHVAPKRYNILHNSKHLMWHTNTSSYQLHNISILRHQYNDYFFIWFAIRIICLHSISSFDVESKVYDITIAQLFCFDLINIHVLAVFICIYPFPQNHSLISIINCFCIYSLVCYTHELLFSFF